VQELFGDALVGVATTEGGIDLDKARSKEMGLVRMKPSYINVCSAPLEMLM
jgi:hypothetical protein